MARQEIPVIVLGADGRPYAGASVYVRTSPGGVDATVYQARTGGATFPNPLTSDAQGRVTGWLDRGDYAATVSSVAGLGPWVEEFPIISGANSAIDDLWVPTDLITARMIAGLAVGTAELQDDAVNAAKIAALAVGTSELQDGAVTLAKRGDVSPWTRVAPGATGIGFTGLFTHYDLTSYGPAEYRRNGDVIEFRGAMKKTSGVPNNGEGCMQINGLAPASWGALAGTSLSPGVGFDCVVGGGLGYIYQMTNNGGSSVFAVSNVGSGAAQNFIPLRNMSWSIAARTTS